MSKQTTLFLLLMLFVLGIARGQITGTCSYDFRDGSIITSGASADGNLTLSGNYVLHGDKYGLDMKVDGEIKIKVAGSCAVKFLGSKYSGLKVKGTAVSEGDLGTQNGKVTNDLAETFDFTYSGPAATLTFKTIADTGNDLYLPAIDVIPAQTGGLATTAEKNIVYAFDLRDKSLVETGGATTIEKGLFKLESGPSNAYGYNGAQHGCEFKTGNKITLQVAGNCLVKIGGCQYSNGTISVSSPTGAFNLASQAAKTNQCYDADGSTVDFIYVGTAGTVVLDFTTKVYVPIIEIVPITYEISLSTYVQKSGTITINDNTFTLTSGATSSDNATISLENGIILSAGKTEAYLALNLGGKDLSTLTPTCTGGISSVAVTDGKLAITFADNTTDPKNYTIKLYDNSILHSRVSYDFRDGSIIAAGKSTDGLLTLGGTYSLHGDKYGLNLKASGTITYQAAASCSFKFLGSNYSSLKMIGSAKTEGDLGTQSTKVNNDLADTYDFVYGGSADTLLFSMVAGSGSDVYLPLVEVIPGQLGAAYPTADKNIIYFFDFRDGTIVPTSTDGKSALHNGLIDIEVGSKNAYGYNGSDHGSYFKEGNQIQLKVAGNAQIKLGGCQYSNGTITASSANGRFDKVTQSSQTTKCYHQDGSTVDFLYVGNAGSITFDFTGTTYVPYIEVVPVPYAVELDPWVKKSGTITINGQVISFTAGDTSTDNATVTVSEGTVISATANSASIRLNLGGKPLSSYNPVVTGDIASATVSGDTLLLTFSDAGSKPNSYNIVLSDNSEVITAEAGKTYSYIFNDGSVFPQTSYSTLRYPVFVTSDGILTLKSNSEDVKKQFGYHDAQHGGVFFPGNSFEFIVAGNATVTFGTCQYGSAKDGIFEFTDSKGTVLGSCPSHDIGTGACGAHSFSYTGPAGTITATLKSTAYPTAEVYIHGVSIENAAIIETSTGKIEVWDFGAVQLDTTLYKNNLTAELINSWYSASITPGSSGNVLPGFTAGVLSWVGGSNDRLRTTNTSLTRYDENIAGAVDYTGRIYVNSTAASGRYLSLTLSADDEVTLVTRTDAGGTINFQRVSDPAAQTDKVSVSDLTTLKFVAKEAGTYHIFDNVGKPSYFRVYRQDARYIDLTGSVNTTEAPGLPENYSIVFKNEAGKTWKSNKTTTGYSVKLPAGYTYSLSLADANGYVISSGSSLTVEENTSHSDVSIKKVELYTLSGSITGIDSKLSGLTLVFTPEAAANKIYVPQPQINTEAKTYTVELEPNCLYTISALGVNDDYIPNNTITIGQANQSANIVFEPKPRYAVLIEASGLNSEQSGKLSLTFTNLNEAGYVYTFTSTSGITLRSGTYSLVCGGLDDYPVETGLISNLKVNDAPVSKSLEFKPVTVWSFDDKAIPNGTPSYKGLLFSGTVSNEVNKGHLSAKAGATIKIPVKVGDKVRITYYYTADFSIDGGTAYTTASNNTSLLEYADYTYPGTESGFVTITVGSGAGTTYFPEIELGGPVDFQATLTVGPDKSYQSINSALNAVAKMVRSNNERVTILIDPGNYEEMLVVSLPNITLKNAAATPSIALLNKGVDIDQAAVRITSYYGHGYNYYSMANNQKWNADILRVNKENGYLTYENKGSGTTNGSYWNATVVVSATGFIAENIIFENSFNQYISKKESEDVVVEWASGGKGQRPADFGNTSVQKRSFVERAAAIAVLADKAILYKCRIVGRQDSYYGAQSCRIVNYKGAMMGAVDYLFGGMVAVFYKSDLVMNVSDDGSDAAYLTAAQQNSGRGYLMYECTVKSTIPGAESASAYKAKPGYFGRPWLATTSEVVFYKATIETSDFPGSEGKSLIAPAGWNSSLGGESRKMYEYATIEQSGENNTSARASWSTILTTPTLTDGTEITTLNFTKGSDGWDPLPELLAADLDNSSFRAPFTSQVKVFAQGDQIIINNVRSATKVSIYGIDGRRLQTFDTTTDTAIRATKGLWIVTIQAGDGLKTAKVMTR